ncbi:MAG: cyclic nucleotide-binding domain-containing protein [Nitrospirae bacterium]|nr:cyclic nucleotide-binding domain-containing protein [Nitrospirota bacterium]
MGSEEVILRLKKTIPLFRDFADAEVVALLKHAKVQNFLQNQVIFREKDPGHCMYLIMSGEVKIHRRTPGGAEQILAVLPAGNYFGEMAIIDGSPRSAQASARVDSALMILDEETLNVTEAGLVIKLFKSFARVLTERLRAVNLQVKELTERLEAKPKSAGDKPTEQAA